MKAFLTVLACALLISSPRAQEDSEVDLSKSFTFRMLVKMEAPLPGLPALATNKEWESGEVVDYTTNNSYGWGRASGKEAGFAISVLPDGAWTWNAGDGSRRIDHRPEASGEGIADGQWHEVGFSIDRAKGVASLYYDGARVALHDLQGVGSLAGSLDTPRIAASLPGVEIENVWLQQGLVSRQHVADEFTLHLGDERSPRHRPLAVWDGSPLRVLAWNIWHGGRRKGRDEGVQRVVEVIRESEADIVLMQETYGSGPRLRARLGFDYYLRSSNLSVFSRFPIVDVHRLYQGFRFGGVTLELRPGVELQAYSLWINYLPDVGAALQEGATGELLAAEDAKTRGKEIDGILEELLPHLDRGPEVPVLVGGDFNSGSHLDWTQAARELPNHQGRVVAWPVSVAMQAAGFVDTYRAAHPDPVEALGLTWSPEFREDHQDRIDYVYAKGQGLRVLASEVLDEHPRGWPSDHAAVLSTLGLDVPPQVGQGLRVMSYNIKHGRGNDGVVDLGRAAKVIREQGPDVVALQEVDQLCGRSGSIDQATWLGQRLGMEAAFGPFMEYDGGQYGMAVLSRLPVVETRNLPLPPGAEPRSAMAVRVRLADGSEAMVVGIHLYASQAERLAQARALLEALEPVEIPVVLAGDFNSEPRSPVLDLLRSDWNFPGKRGQRFTFPSQRPAKEIDYFFLRGFDDWQASPAQVLDEPVVSDHQSLVISLWRDAPR